jgi:hypothetical protein
MTGIELPRAQRIETTGDGGRRRNILKGELLVTPVEPLIWTDAYIGRQTLEPGRTHLALEHGAVRKRPELFRPAMAGDKVTANRMREMLQRAERQERREIARLRGGSRVAARPRTQTWRLPSDEGRVPWRLP